MGKRSVLFFLGLISLSVVANATRVHHRAHTHAANTYRHYVGDFDGDGVSDFVRQKDGGWAGDGKDTAVLFTSSGRGTFWQTTLKSNFDLRGDLTNLYVGDFNGDGRDDLLRQEKGSWTSDRVNTAYLLLSNGKDDFEKIVLDESYDLNGELTNLYIGDFNGDGKDDVLRQEKGSWASDNVNMAYLLLSQGESFKKIVLPDNLDLNGELTVLSVGDFNGDGKADVLRREKGSWANDRVNTAYLLISQGDSFKRIVLDEDLNIPASLTNAYIGDFDGDGKDDVLRQEKGDWTKDAVNMATVLLSTGSSFKSVAYPYDAEMSGEISTLFVGDYNGDGLSDFLQIWNLDTYYLHFAQGEGRFF